MVNVRVLEKTILVWIQENIRIKRLNPIVKVYTYAGNGGTVWIVVCLALTGMKKTRKIGIYSMLSLIFSSLITNLGLKLVFERTRPYEVMNDISPMIITNDPNSFPSGHTSAAFAAGVLWAKTSEKQWVKNLAILQAILMGFSRMYVGVHYPSDVIAGALVGGLCSSLAIKFGDFMSNKYFKQKPVL